MIISHKYKFIFLKTLKTAGTSIEIALSKHCGADDIITTLSPEDEEIRKALGYTGSQNYLFPIWDYRIRDLVTLIRLRRKRNRFYNHISAKKVRTRIGEQVWTNYYKFCFERNPWDRVVSFFYWVYRSEPRPPAISDFIKSEKLLTLKRRGYDLYTIDGKIAVDKVCRYENLSEELEAIRTQVGIPEKLVLPFTKSKYRKDKRSYREILRKEDADYIAELFRDEINLWGYEF